MTARFQNPPIEGYFQMPAAFHEGFKVAPRHIVEAIVDELVEMLDRADGDPDLEDDDPLEDDNEDRCAAYDEGPCWAPCDFLPGDPDDAEDEHDREGVEFG